MYAAKVRLGLGPAPAQPIQGERQDSKADQVDDQIDSIAFSAGNPRVEHITGVVHLFKEVPASSQPVGPIPALPVHHLN